MKDTRLFLSGDWHEVTLTLHYSLAGGCSWWDEGVRIARPHPHGDKLEAIAQEMYPLLRDGDKFSRSKSFPKALPVLHFHLYQFNMKLHIIEGSKLDKFKYS
ncbi:MAG: hypothetical protein V7L00_33080 [Nostoc sp.]|uniref:hypothetical protein n=1 Tax=Nostoc sp. TaxID=1180 RepID=UPI002FF4B082